MKTFLIIVPQNLIFRMKKKLYLPEKLFPQKHFILVVFGMVLNTFLLAKLSFKTNLSYKKSDTKLFF